MKKTLVWLGISAATGAAAGILLNRRNPKQGGLIGAALGTLAGSVAAELYRTVSEDGIVYYSKSSPLYEDSDDVEYV